MSNPNDKLIEQFAVRTAAIITEKAPFILATIVDGQVKVMFSEDHELMPDMLAETANIMHNVMHGVIGGD